MNIKKNIQILFSIIKHKYCKNANNNNIATEEQEPPTKLAIWSNSVQEKEDSLLAAPFYQ